MAEKLKAFFSQTLKWILNVSPLLSDQNIIAHYFSIKNSQFNKQFNMKFYFYLQWTKAIEIIQFQEAFQVSWFFCNERTFDLYNILC